MKLIKKQGGPCQNSNSVLILQNFVSFCEYHNYPFFTLKVFSDSTCYPKNRCTNIIPVQIISSNAILLFGRWLMVVASVDHGSNPDFHGKHPIFAQTPSSMYTVACNLCPLLLIHVNIYFTLSLKARL